MKLLFVADGRSPTALNWIQYFVETGHEVHLASTYPCAPELRLASLAVIPVAGGEQVGKWANRQISKSANRQGGGRVLRRIVPVGLRTALRQWLGPVTLPRAARQLRGLIAQARPDLIHAMRIPYEGMVITSALSHALSEAEAEVEGPPLLVSVWGNDFTLHARANPWMARLTRQTLSRADALHTDCQRDLRLARQWGFAADKPAVALPGGGGVRLEVFYPPPHPSPLPLGEGGDTEHRLGVREGVVINPRGMRAYVRNDTFFRAIPLVLARRPETRFVCPAMAGEAQAEKWVRELGIASAVELLPLQTRPQMAGLFRQSQVAVSITTHDGTPNTLLEAMACGCYPVAGDLESLREWINPGVNGSLTAPDDPSALAAAILAALENSALRESAASHNVQLIAEKAEYGAVMRQAEEFYKAVFGVQYSVISD